MPPDTLDELRRERTGHQRLRTLFKISEAAARTQAARAIYDRLYQERRLDAALLDAAIATMGEFAQDGAGRQDLAELQQTADQVRAILHQERTAEDEQL